MSKILAGLRKHPVWYTVILAIIICVIGINEVLSFASAFIINENWFVNSLICIFLIGLISMYLLKIQIWR